MKLVKSVGADETIDYTAVSLPDHLVDVYSARPFDAVVDTVGQSQPLYHRSPQYLAPEKPFLCIGTYLGDELTLYNVFLSVRPPLSNRLWPKILGGTPRAWEFLSGEERVGTSLKVVHSMVEAGKVQRKIDSVFDMDDVTASFAILALLGAIAIAHTYAVPDQDTAVYPCTPDAQYSLDCEQPPVTNFCARSKKSCCNSDGALYTEDLLHCGPDQCRCVAT
ncbi:Uu.00g007290.m01.CDS01 [Anthostomella pinea]|uniref:Uu.00g007290.m01.CDS01 n=1 Tax=Anthostomella pinea TaxID=933095 RepID=A0AAI8VXL3_9PEZI|nr:Uu.00g007290.m01.CDS01 [Anthostomella pinea]